MTTHCPHGHQSADPDYCSECGTRIQTTPSVQSAAVITPASQVTQLTTASTASTAGDLCPDCATRRPTGARYCEVCRYDFQSHVSFTPHSGASPASVPSSVDSQITPVIVPLQAPAAVTPVDPPVVAPAPTIKKVSAQRLQLRVVADPTLDKEPDPAKPCPVGQPERIFHLDLEENILGRQYEGKGIHPEIVINDPGISRRHLKFLRNPDREFSVLELGSANGTHLNGKLLESGVVTPIHPGDSLILGVWTRIVVEAR